MRAESGKRKAGLDFSMNVESPRLLRRVLSWVAAWLRGNWRSILTVLFLGFVLNLIPDFCENGRTTHGLPRTILFGEWFHYGNLAYNIAIWSGLAIGWCVWRQLRASEQNRYFQIRLIDIAFATAIIAAATAYCVDLQKEAEHGEQLLALSNRKTNLNNLTLDVPWFVDCNLTHRRSNAAERPKWGYRIVQCTVPSPHLADLSTAEQSQIFDHLAHLQHLQVLSLYNRNTTPAMTARLQNMRSLHFLRLEVQSEAGAHFEQAALIPNLRGIDIHSVTVTDEDIDPLKHVPHLRFLTIDAGGEFHGQKLSQFPQLRRLRLRNINWTPAVFEQIGKMPLLEFLGLNNISTDSSIGSEDWRQLAQLKRLKSLQFNNCETFSKEAIRALSLLPNLHEVYLDGSTVTDELVRYLPELPPQIRLTIEGSRLSYSSKLRLEGLFRDRQLSIRE